MKRTKGSQSEIGMLYQYGVTSLLAGELSANEDVEDYIIYSSERSAGKFDDIVARVKLKQQDEWYLSLIQVKYKETNNLNVSDILQGKSVKCFLSDYLKNYNIIMTDSYLTCRLGICSDNIRVAIFCDKSIQTPVFLRNECTFEFYLSKHTTQTNIENVLLPFGNKCWKFTCEDLQQSEHQRFLDGCYLYLDQPDYYKINKHIQRICEISSANDIINYVKDYFNNDWLYKQGLTKEAFEIELQRLRLSDVLLPPTSFINLVEDDRIAIWNRVTLEQDITIVYNEDNEVESCLYSCLVKSLNTLLNISTDWREYVHGNKTLSRDIINKFVAYSKTKPIRYWIYLPNNLKSLIIELWKYGGLPLILKTDSELSDFEKYAHLKRSYIIVSHSEHSLWNVSNSKLKIFSCVSEIANLELRSNLLNTTLMSLQGRSETTLRNLLKDDNELMATITASDILGTMKTKSVSLREDYLKGCNYLLFVIEDDNYVDIVEPLVPCITGSNIKIYCPSKKIKKCMEVVESDTRFQNYTVYHLRLTHERLEIIQGDKYKLRNYFIDQYGNAIRISEENQFISIIGQPVMAEEVQHIRRYLRNATIPLSMFFTGEKQICLVSGDLESISYEIDLSCEGINISELIFKEEKTYFIKASVRNQDHWNKLQEFGYPIFDIRIRGGKMELLKYNHCKNLIPYISYEGQRFSEDDLFEEFEIDNHGVVVIAGEAGMGKTSLLKSVCSTSISHNYTIFYDLKNFQIHLRKQLLLNPIEFIFKEFHKGISKKYTNFLNVLLKRKKLIVILDSFDEVRSACEKQLMEFIQTLAGSGAQIVIATRLEGCNMLIGELSVHAIKIEPLNSDAGNEYVLYWKLSQHVLSNIPHQWAINPLYLNFLRILSTSEGQISAITKCKLYENVIQMTAARWLRSNNRIVSESDIDVIISLFERLALVAMFGKEVVEEELLWSCDATMHDYTKFGIVTYFDEDCYPIFYHYTFVEFLVAQWIVKAKQVRMHKSFAKYVYLRLFNEGKLHVLNILLENLALHESILKEDMYKVEKLLQSNLHCLDMVDKFGRTALHIAIICCKRAQQPYSITEHIIKCMLRSQCDFEKRDSMLEWNWTDYVQSEVFEYAFIYMCMDTIKVYLNLRRKKLDEFDYLTPVFPSKYFCAIAKWATETNSITVIQDLLLLQNCGNRRFLKFYQACSRDTTDMVPVLANKLELEVETSPLHIATIYGSVYMVCHLIGIGADVNVIDLFTLTPLHYSIMRLFLPATQNEIHNATLINLKIIEALLQAGAAVNVRCFIVGNYSNPLYFAVQAGNVDAVKMLLKFGASVNIKSDGGNTPLHTAIKQGYLDIVQCLLDNEANIHLLNDAGETSIDIAIAQDNVDIRNLLIQTVDNEKNVLSETLNNKGNPVFIRAKGSKSSYKDLNSGPLMDAAYKGDIDLVKLLLRNGENVNAQTTYGRTALHEAACTGHVNIVKLLIDKGADVNVRNKYGVTPLFDATCQENPEIIQILLENGASANCPNYYNSSPLNCAAREGRVNIAKILIEAGVSVNNRTKFNNSVLHAAVRSGNKDVVELLLEKGADLNAQNVNGHTALHVAIHKGQVNVVKLLLEKGARKDVCDEKGMTHLHFGIYHNEPGIVRLLLQHGANADVLNMEGCTPLHLAIKAQNTNIVKMLLDAGVKLTCESKDGCTPFFIAIQKRNALIVRLLLEYEATVANNISTTNEGGTTALHHAILREETDIVRYLLHNGSNANAQGFGGGTSLHVAAIQGNSDIIRLLLENGAKPDVEGNRGIQPLHCATVMGHTNVAELLLNGGANASVLCENGYSVLHIAAEKGCVDIVTLLLARGADVNAVDETGTTPLYVATENGYANIVTILLNNGANPNISDKVCVTPLHLATGMGYESIVRLLLNNGANTCVTDQNGRTPLHYSIPGQNANIVKKILNSQGNVNVRDRYGNTPLHYGIVDQNLNILFLLLTGGADETINNNSGKTPFHLAMCKKCRDIVKLLLQRTENTVEANDNASRYVDAEGVNIELVSLILKKGCHIKPNNKDITVIFFYAAEGYPHIMQMVLDKGVNRNIQDCYGRTALHISVSMQKLEIVEILVTKGAKLDIGDENKKTPLHYAIETGNMDIIKVLLNGGADVNAQDMIGHTPLHRAIVNRNQDVAALLLHEGATVSIKNNVGIIALDGAVIRECTDVLLNKNWNINFQDIFGNTALHFAVVNKNAGIVRLLLESGADESIKNEKGNTPLHLAMCERCGNSIKMLLQHGLNAHYKNTDKSVCLDIEKQKKIEENIEIIYLIVQARVDINVESIDILTIFFYTALEGRFDIFQKFLEKGVNVNVQDKFRGRTVLHVSVEKENLNFIDLLLIKGANVNLQDGNGNTPLHLAVDRENETICRLLLERGATVCIRNNNEKTPLDIATDRRRTNIISLLETCYINAIKYKKLISAI